MNTVLTTLLEMSFTASILILVVLIIRVFCKKLPRWTFCLFWGLVAIRLVVPVTFESHLSLMPSADKYKIIIEETALPEAPTVTKSEIPQVNPEQEADPALWDGETTEEVTKDPQVLPNVETSSDITEPQKSQSVPNSSKVMHFLKSLTVLEILFILWLVGMIGMLVYAGISSGRLYRKVAEAICIRDNIWICDQVTTPFILGVLRPRILLPSSIKEEELTYILTHEETHLRRWDPLWKVLGFVVLAVHWYNPLVWLAYSMFCKDMEYACDEASVKQYDLSGRKAYSSALLTYSIQRKNLVVYPIAFGRISAKERVRMVLQYKKKAIVWSVLAMMLIIVIAVCFLTKPVTKQQGSDAVESEAEISSEVEEESSEAADNSEESIFEDQDVLKLTKIEDRAYNWKDFIGAD